MPTRRFKSKEQQALEARLGVISSWGFSVKRDRASVFPGRETDSRPVMLDGNRYPTGRQMAGVKDPLAAIGRVKSYWKTTRPLSAGKTGSQPIENLPLGKGPMVKLTIALAESIYSHHIAGVALSSGNSQPTNAGEATGIKSEPQA